VLLIDREALVERSLEPRDQRERLGKRFRDLVGIVQLRLVPAPAALRKGKP
jgi:hypothetical protein